jgi:hypothetical protein
MSIIKRYEGVLYFSGILLWSRVQHIIFFSHIVEWLEISLIRWISGMTGIRTPNHI